MGEKSTPTKAACRSSSRPRSSAMRSPQHRPSRRRDRGEVSPSGAHTSRSGPRVRIRPFAITAPVALARMTSSPRGAPRAASIVRREPARATGLAVQTAAFASRSPTPRVPVGGDHVQRRPSADSFAFVVAGACAGAIATSPAYALRAPARREARTAGARTRRARTGEQDERAIGHAREQRLSRRAPRGSSANRCCGQRGGGFGEALLARRDRALLARPRRARSRSVARSIAPNASQHDSATARSPRRAVADGASGSDSWPVV